MSVPSSALRHTRKRYNAYTHKMSAEDDVHRDGDISGPSQVPSAKAPATVATSGVLFGMISMGGSAFKAFDVDISNMDKADLLKALADDCIFSFSLKDVDLSKSQVWIMKTPSDDEVLASDRSNAMLLKGRTQVESVVDGIRAAAVVDGDVRYAYVAVVTSSSPSGIPSGVAAVRLSGDCIVPSHTSQFNVIATACGMFSDDDLNYVDFQESKAHFLGYRNPSRRALPAPVIGNMINSFIHTLETRKLSEVGDADLTHVMRLCHLGAQLFAKETDKNAEYCKVLDAFLQDARVQPSARRKIPASSSTLVKHVTVGKKNSTDSTAVYVATVRGTKNVVIPVYIGEHERYNGSSYDPTVQLLYYYRGFLTELPLVDSWMYPCVGLTVVDNIIVVGILYLLPPDEDGVRYMAYSHVDSYVLHYYSASSKAFQRVVAFFTAMRELVTQLRAYYDTMSPSNEGALRSPMPSSLTVGETLSGKLHVKPQPMYYSKLLFSGEVITTFGKVPEGVKQVVVKYAEFYGQEAHEAAARLGIAPALYAVESISSDMKVIVMEMLVGYTPLCSIDDVETRRAAVQAVANAAKALHEMGFVHGDLHAANVMVKDGSGGAEIRLVDWDWSGRSEVDVYPAIPNPSLAWHDKVARGEVLSADHDVYACTELAKYAEDPEVEQKRQTAIPPRTPPKTATLVVHEAVAETPTKLQRARMLRQPAAGAGIEAADTTTPIIGSQTSSARKSRKKRRKGRK